jgi:hypothetical protein
VLHIISNLLPIKELLRLNSITGSVCRMAKLFQFIWEVVHIISNLLPIKDSPKLSAIMGDVCSLVPVCSETVQVPFDISNSQRSKGVQAVNLELGE